jgi:hypothetical protein
MSPSTTWRPVTLKSLGHTGRARCKACRVTKDPELIYSILHLPPGQQAAVWNALGCTGCGAETDYICDSCRQRIWHSGVITKHSWLKAEGAPQPLLDKVKAQRGIPQDA